MKLDADEKELLESVEQGEWKSAGGGKRERTRYSHAKATFPQGSAVEHPALEQGPGGDPEAGARGRPAVPDAHLKPLAQVRVGTAQRGVSRPFRKLRVPEDGILRD
jgi:hypothetical protein